MPRLSDSMEEGTVLQWLKQAGDEVRRGEEIVEIETDKATMTYESEFDGVLLEILAPEGETLPLGAPIARIGEPGSAPAADDGGAAAEERGAAAVANGAAARAGAATAPAAAAPAAAAPAAATAPPWSEPHRGGRAKASPVARRIAGELGVDLASLQGSGPRARITKADVEAAARAAATEAAPQGPPAGDGNGAPDRAPEPAAPQPATAPGPAAYASGRADTPRGTAEIVEPSRLQQTVARRMAESKATAPHFYLSADIDMTEAAAFRAQLKGVAGEGDVLPSFNDLVVKACAGALRKHPRANGAYRDGRFELYSRVNVGIAVAADDALVVPTIFDADQKGLGEIARQSRALAGKVRDGAATPPELSGGTFTVSNLGMYGISNFAAVINPPQAAILAVGSIAKRPVWEAAAGAFVPRDVMGVTLACDHRILYGADAAELLATIRRLLEQPLSLLL